MGIGWTRPRMASCTQNAARPSSARKAAHAALGGGGARSAAGANGAGGAARGAGDVMVVTGELIEDTIDVTMRDGKGGGVVDGTARVARNRERVARKEKEQAKTRRVLKVQPRAEQRA